MEDIISLNLIKQLYQSKGIKIDDKKALNFLIKLEKNIVKVCINENKLSLNNNNIFLRKKIEEDSQFKESYKKFIQQHNLNNYKVLEKSSIVPVIAEVMADMLVL